MIWSILNAACFLIAIIAALARAKDAGVGVGGYSLAATIGLGLGFISAWTVWRVGEKDGAAAQKRLGDTHWWHDALLYLLYLVVVAWALFTAFIASHLTAAVLHATA